MAKTTINIAISKPDDTPEEGYIYFRLATADALDGVEYSDRTPVRVNLDNDGLATIQLQPNDDPGWTIEGNSYLVEERFGGKAPRRFYMVVPTSVPALDYADLATYANAPSITANIDLAAEWAAWQAAAKTYDLLSIFNVKDYGAVGNGVANDTAAIQAAITAAGQGGTVYFPTGYYKFSNLTITAAVHLAGAGVNVASQYWFGSADLVALTPAEVGGSVLISTATSGNAIKVDAVGATRGFSMSNLGLIGPGSGTSSGLVLGATADGSQMIRPRLRNVAIGNFEYGLRGNAENGTFDSVYLFACKTGLQGDQYFNGNVFTGLNVETCLDYGIRLVIECISNVFTGGVLQGNQGIVVAVDAGMGNRFEGIFFENASATWSFDIVAGRYTTVEDCFFAADTYPSARIIGDYNRWVHNDRSPPVYVEGDYNVVDTQSVITDLGVGNRLPHPPWQSYTPALSNGWVLGNGVATGSYVAIGKTIHWRAKIVFGSTSTFGASIMRVSLPTTAANDIQQVTIAATDYLTSLYAFDGSPFDLGKMEVVVRGTNGVVSSVTSTVPFTWAENDEITLAGTYQAA